MKFAILGGGLSGLACAAGLRDRGHEVVIIEREPSIGGLARSLHIDGYAFDYGPHLLSGDDAFLGLLRHLAPELSLTRLQAVSERMYLNGKYLKFPLDPFQLMTHVHPARLPALLIELFGKQWSPGASAAEPDNLEDWVVHHVGRRFYEHVSLREYFRKLYGISPRHATKHWGVHKLRLVANWRKRGLLSLAGALMRRRRRLKSEALYHPGIGVGAIAEGIGANLLRRGVEIQIGAAAMTIDLANDSVHVSVQRDGRTRGVHADFVISTLPLPRLIDMLEPEVPPKVRVASATLQYRSLVLLYLCVRKERVLDHLSVHFPESDYVFRRVTEFKHKNAAMAPDGKTGLCVEITCSRDDGLYQLADEHVFDVVVPQLERGGFLRREDVESYHLVRVPSAYPVFDLPSIAAMQGLLHHLSELPRLLTLGRQGLFSYNSMQTSLDTGYETALQLAEGPSAWKRVRSGVYGQRLGQGSAGDTVDIVADVDLEPRRANAA